MHTSISRFLMPACLMMSALTVQAQTDSESLLGSQRSEKQFINPVPGKKVTDRKFVLNPTPQNITMTPDGGCIDPKKGFNIRNVDKAFADDLGFLTENSKGLKLTVKFGKDAAKKGVEAREGAYIMNVTPKGVEIYGHDEAGAFYGLQTLRQIIMTSADGMIPCLAINDFPSLTRRGVVEGFYGTPWSHEVRKSLIKFLGENKMNTFIFAPKDDPYHSSPNWRKPYPADQARDISELVDVARKNRVNLVWAIHPGQDIRWDDEDFKNLVNKFEMMYDLGVRSFFIFFDDISGEGTNPHKQVELLNRLNREFVQAKGDVSKLTVCPTDYTKLWANPSQDGALAIYGRTLDKDIDVMYTGDVVCADLTRSTMDFFDNLVQRPGYFWWNFPVSDYCREYLLMGPSYGLDNSLTDKEVTALVSNPMEHGEASKIAIYGVGDYSWNISEYNPMDAWERALAELIPGAPDAFRTFAIHAADSETGYRRAESWETETFDRRDYTPEQFSALKKDFEAVKAAPAAIMAACTNPLLMKEIKPWLTQFEILGKRGLNTLDLIKIFPTADKAGFWNKYAENVMTESEQEAFNAHRAGTLKLRPFCDNAMNSMLTEFYKHLTGRNPNMYRPIGSYRNINTPTAWKMLDSKDTTYWHSGQGQKPGHWVGLDLHTVRPVSEVLIYQGRNNEDDSDFYENAIVETSVDGKAWTALGSPAVRQYTIHLKCEPVDARYVRLRRLDSKRTNWVSIRRFEVNPATAESLGFKIQAETPEIFARAFDGDPSSVYPLVGSPVSFGRTDGVEKLTLLMGKNPQITAEQLDAAGKVISTDKFTSPFAEITLKPATATVRLSGSGTIHEVIPASAEQPE